MRTTPPRYSHKNLDMCWVQIVMRQIYEARYDKNVFSFVSIEDRGRLSWNFYVLQINRN